VTGPSPLAVVAIGGNALISDEGHQQLADQARAVAGACGALADLAARGWRVVVTHGNGPQVGFILRRSEIAHDEVPEVPMDYATADTQGAIGSMFQRALFQEFFRRNLALAAVTLVTHVEVDPSDPAFARPDKPIGPFFAEARARYLAETLGWKVGEDSGRGWRRLVASPQPVAILEVGDIAHLAGQGRMVVACGGGGIPVVRGSDGSLTGVEAVIDKDRTSALLARILGADAFLLCTGVDAVFTGWGTPQARRLDQISTTEARALLAAGEFGAGSMAPKVEAALDYLAGPRPPGAVRRAVIGRLERLADLVEGTTGTAIEDVVPRSAP
jgi:carbamate kinase